MPGDFRTCTSFALPSGPTVTAMNMSPCAGAMLRALLIAL